MNWVTKWFVRRKLKSWERENMGKIKSVIAWFNEKPGRRRYLAAVFVAVSAALQTLGHTEWAKQVGALNDVIQVWLVSGFDVAGLLTLAVSIKKAKI